MGPDIFIDDFEITDNTEELHSILGRCIIVATRFDHLCDITSKFLKLKYSGIILLSESEYSDFVNSLFNKFSNLFNNIRFLPIDQSAKDILHDARKARNEVAHSLTIGMTGCLDMKVEEISFKSNVSLLIDKISSGDFLISSLLSILNKDPLPYFSENSYKQKVVNWVLGK